MSRRIKYKRFADYSLYAHCEVILSLLALSLSAILSDNKYFLAAAIVFVLIHTLFTALIYRLGRYVYPDRNLPSVTEAESKNLLDYMDDGEKHVALQGLYQSFNIVNMALLFAILFATVYSTGENNSPQTFSIIRMSVIFLLVNVRYLWIVRNK